MGMQLPVALSVRGGTVWGRSDTGQAETDSDLALFTESLLSDRHCARSWEGERRTVPPSRRGWGLVSDVRKSYSR